MQHPQVFRSKYDLPLISLGNYGECPTTKGCIRHAANVQEVCGIEVDYDAGKMSIDEAAAKLTAARIEAVLYTSPSHTPEKPRWRGLLRLAVPVAPKARAALVGRVNRVLGGVLARESFTLSQSFFIGRVEGCVEYRVLETAGAPIDQRPDISPQYFPSSSTTTDLRGNFDATPDSELRAAFARGEDRYNSMQKLSARWAARGMKEDDIAAALHALLNESPDGAKNADGVDLRSRVAGLAASAVKKFGETRAESAPKAFELLGPSAAIGSYDEWHGFPFEPPTLSRITCPWTRAALSVPAATARPRSPCTSPC